MGVGGQSHDSAAYPRDAKMSVRFLRCLTLDVTNHIRYLVNGEISYCLHLCELFLLPQFLYRKKPESALNIKTNYGEVLEMNLRHQSLQILANKCTYITLT